MGKQNYIQSFMNTTQRRSKEELNADLGKLKTKLNNLWGPFSFVLSPIFETMNPETLNLKQYNKKTSKRDLKIEIDDESLQKSSSQKSLKKVSPKSSLTICEEKLIVESLVSKIDCIMGKLNKEFNPIAQATPFYLRKKPTGAMEDYLNYLCFTTLAGNWYIMAEAIRIWELVAQKREEIIHENSVHRLIGCCCLLAAKFSYDGYNSKGFEKVLGVRKSKMADMEKFLFLDVLNGNLELLPKNKKQI